LKKAEIYRNCWIIGNGFVDLDAIFIALQDQHLLVRATQFKNLFKFPHSDRQLLQGENVSEDVKLCRSAYNVYLEQEGLLETVEQYAHSLGIERVLDHLQNSIKLFDQHFQIDSSILNGKNLLLFVDQLFMRAFQLSSLAIFNAAPTDITKQEGLIQERFQSFVTNFDPLLKLDASLAVKEFERQNRARKLQRFCRAKLSNWYKLISKILKTKITKMVQSHQIDIHVALSK